MARPESPSKFCRQNPRSSKSLGTPLRLATDSIAARNQPLRPTPSSGLITQTPAPQGRTPAMYRGSLSTPLSSLPSTPLGTTAANVSTVAGHLTTPTYEGVSADVIMSDAPVPPDLADNQRAGDISKNNNNNTNTPNENLINNNNNRSYIVSGDHAPVYGSRDVSVMEHITKSNSNSEQRDSDDLSNVGDHPNAYLIKQPESRPISQEQLAAEVKGIYAGLVLVEAKCVNVVTSQQNALKEVQSGIRSSSSTPYVDHWQALTALHRTLLHEHHDFFLASQHPSAAPALRELASKYAMPARMWRHGIHSFLELLRQRLPASSEYMVAFIYQAYQMMALLYETVPGFEETWIECLGDLARYRMAIEDEDLKIRETWTAVASYWYGKASDKSPKVGRLYHHLAILARTQALFQLSLYCRSLTAVVPFPSARESILTLLEPSLTRQMYNNLRQPSPDPWFVRYSALLFTNGASDAIVTTAKNFITHLEAYLTGNEEWKKKGTYVAICIVGTLFLFGKPQSSLREIFVGRDAADLERKKAGLMPESDTLGSPDSPSHRSLVETAKNEASHAWRMMYATCSMALLRPGDSKVVPHLTVLLTFFLCLASTEQGHQLLDDDFPRDLLANYLNEMINTPGVWSDGVEASTIPKVEMKIVAASVTPTTERQFNYGILPEDYAMHGQVWSQGFFPEDFFKTAPTDEDERVMEHARTDQMRKERLLWLGIRLANIDAKKRRHSCRWLSYNSMEQAFSVESAHGTEQLDPGVNRWWDLLGRT